MTGTWREREATPRALAMSASAHSLVPTIVVKFLAVAMAALVTLSAGVAYAAWIASGTGMSSARAVTAGAGNAPTSAVSGRTVSLSWSASTYSNGVAVTTYLVKRYNSAGTIEQAIATGTCAALVTGTACSQTAAPSGSWRYTVTPAVGSWRGAESAQVAVSVGSPTVSLTPTLTRATATLTGSVANFLDGESLTFRLDNPTSGTVLAGTVGGVATPTAVPCGRGRCGHRRAARRHDGGRAHGVRRRLAQRRERRPGHHRRQHPAAGAVDHRRPHRHGQPRRRPPSPSPTPSHP